MVSPSEMEMKVSLKKGVGFFIRAASVFLQGAEAREATDSFDARPAREPVDELQVSGLGDAISVAIAVAQRMEADGLAEIVSVETRYQELPDSYSPQLVVRLRRVFHASLEEAEGQLAVATWNLAAINNNPFEYWISHTDAAYNQLMDQVEKFIDQPGEKDVPVAEVFSDSLFQELCGLMKAENWPGLEKVEELWKSDLSQRKIISGVLKEKELGAKRLCSMPDRFTNTINVATGSVVFRPTVINHSANVLSSVGAWWPQWASFMFKEELEVRTGKNGSTKRIRPCQMLSLIKKAKYPAISEEEEAISVPLQCLCLAIFDAILVHMLQVLSPDGHWLQIKESICKATFRQKNLLTTRILQSYSGASVVCLQEASAAYLQSLQSSSLARTHHVVIPEKVDGQRDQNSALLLRRDVFPEGAEKEITDEVIAALEGTAGVEVGDLIAVQASHSSGRRFLVASFHGDTNGQATAPVLKALLRSLGSDALLLGIDANTYLKGSASLYGVQDFLQECRGASLRSCWPEDGDMAKCLTTCNARTFLQPQLNKACPSAKKLETGDVNPKDHIIFSRDLYEPIKVIKDNTGKGEYIEGVCFPSLSFPSDHGMVAAVLKPKL
mmetsp:Transcript_52479/g.122448  ORF Transcript_52479/g.122448 Transcript_52479/m.122448 type:complete len:612 (+) Transcript_52479:46-1881(+)